MSTLEKLIELLANEQILSFDNNHLMSTIVDGESVIVCSKFGENPALVSYDNLTSICEDSVIADQIEKMYAELTLSKMYDTAGENVLDLKERLESSYKAKGMCA